ncbi:hypothetical protein ACGFRB_24425 [Streptomyces sp. NPDC048718]|uniref:hypothetical protein n=1 Tax=Streptomyces sp. NPDC048718 TaxID=3365587 RepID=UPI0037230D98
MPRTTRRVTVTAAAALALACSAGTRPVPSTPPAAVSGPSARQHQDRFLEAAEHRLVVECLEAQGLSLPPAFRARAPDPAPAEETRPWTALSGKDPREPSLTLVTGVTGVTGCTAEARVRLYGDQTRWFRARATVDNLRAEAHARMRDDPAYRAAFDRWTRCATPVGARRAGRTAPAVAGRCGRESGLADVRARREPVELAAVRALHRDQVTTYEQMRAGALKRAAELSAPPSPTGKGGDVTP